MLTSGCLASRETREGADDLEQALGTPDWASSVEVRSGRDGQLADEVRTRVVINGSATPQDVAEFVVAMPRRVVDAGLEDVGATKNLTFETTSGATLEIDWQGEVSPDEVGRGVAEWFAVVPVVPGVAASVRSSGGASYVITLPEGDRRQVARTYERLVDLAEPDTTWQVDGTDGGLALRFAASVLPTQDQRAVWTRLVAALDELPPDLPASEVSLRLLDRTVAELTLVAPDGTTTETFTVEDYGERVWPVVRPQLDALAEMPGEWSYFANWVPTSAPTSRTGFISLLTDLPVTDNGDESTRWSQEAKDHVG
jgi:hypothetical protein